METQAEVLAELKKLNKNISKLNTRLSPARALISGILSGLGSVIGATLVVAFIAFLLRNVNVVPIIGDWLSEIFTHVVNNLPPN